jgi:hypothetical protein
VNRVTRNRAILVGAIVVLLIVAVTLFMRRGASAKGNESEGQPIANIQAFYDKRDDKALSKLLDKLTGTEAESSQRILLHVAFEFPESHLSAMEAIRRLRLTVDAGKVLSIYVNSKAVFKGESLISMATYKWDDSYLPALVKVMVKEPNLKKRVAGALAQSGSYQAEKKLIAMQKKSDPDLFYSTVEEAHNAKNTRLAKRLLKMCKTFKSETEEYKTCVEQIKDTIAD